jgi:hypothetical protein
MSLDFQLTEIRDYLELYTDDKLEPKWEAFILMTISTGIGVVTEKNVDEVWERMNIVQAVDGPWLRQGMAAMWFSRDDVVRMVGLRTNVFPKESKASFMRKMSKSALDKAVYRHKHQELPSKQPRVE